MTNIGVDILEHSLQVYNLWERWSGHFARIPKEFLGGELTEKRPADEQKLKYKDSIKTAKEGQYHAK